MVAAHQVPLHRMLGIEWLYYLHIPSDLPRVYCDHTHRLYTHGSIPIASYILPPPTPCQVRGTVQRALWQPCEGIVLER